MSETNTIGAYELVGEPLDPRDVTLSLKSATMVRDYITQDYFPWLTQEFPDRQFVTQFTGESEVLAFGATYGPNEHTGVMLDSDTSGFTGLHFTHTDHTWRLRARNTIYKHDGTPNKVSVTYALDAEEDWVLQARVSAHILSCDPAEFFELKKHGSAEQALDRRVYVRHMTIRDCIRLQQQLRTGAEQKLQALQPILAG